MFIYFTNSVSRVNSKMDIIEEERELKGLTHEDEEKGLKWRKKKRKRLRKREEEDQRMHSIGISLNLAESRQ